MVVQGRVLAVSASLVLLGACGGGGDNSVGPPPPVVNDSPGGIWKGEATDGSDVLAIVTEDGDFHFLALDSGAQFFGEVSVDSHDVTGDFTGVTPFGTAFEDGSTSGTGTITGTVDERNTLSIDTDFTTHNGTDVTSSVDLTYDDLYERDSALATIAGNFETSAGEAVSVSDNGVIFSQNADTGCTLNGTVGIVDTHYNAYNVSFTYADCTGDSAALNGVTFTGIATLDDSTSPEQMIVGAHHIAGSVGESAVFVLKRT